MLITQIKKFFIGAFGDMKRSAAAQHELDRAEFAATRAESRAAFEKHRGHNTFAAAKAASGERRASQETAREERLADAQRRIAEANARTEAARKH